MPLNNMSKRNDYSSINLWSTFTFFSVLQEGALVERKASIRSFMKSIQVSGDEAVLTYSIPELPEKVSLGEAGVPRFVQYGGR